MDSLLTLSGTRLSEMIKNKEISSREAVEKHIEHIQKVNPVLNAVVADRFETARKEADRADLEVKTSDPQKLPPFHGVPCTIKECLALTGMPNTCGLDSRKGIIPSRDATAVARVREAGAIPMGVTNVPELCMWVETYSHIYGRCKNPYDPNRTTGGSSGGEGAIIGAGASPFGLGSDIAGSIRYPAFYNGIFGHKPSGGIVPNTGQYPPLDNNVRRYLTTGPLARRAEDIFPLLRIIAGPDGEEDCCENIRLGDPSKVRIDKLKVISIEDHWFLKIDPELRDAQRRCADYLEEKGACVIRDVRLDSIKKALGIWIAMIISELETSVEDLIGGERMVFPREIFKMIRGKSMHIGPIVVLVMLERLIKFTDKTAAGVYLSKGTQKLVDAGLQLKEDISRLLGNNGIMLYPSNSSPAPLHGRPLKFPLEATYMFIANVLEFPTTQVPLGLSSAGLPLGVQVMGNYGRDHITAAVALEFEKAFGGWVPPWLK
jgi:fatty acid amide hydrolase 2